MAARWQMSLTWSNHRLRGRPTGLRPSGFAISKRRTNLSSGILSTCPSQRSCNLLRARMATLHRRFLDSLLPRNCNSDATTTAILDDQTRARESFLRQVYSGQLLIISCGLMHILGYRKGYVGYISLLKLLTN